MWIKSYVVVMIQLIIWSGYSVIEWLSKHDQPLYNRLMFFVFLYLAFVIGNIVIKSVRKTAVVTLVSLSLYSLVHVSLPLITHFAN